MPELWLAFGAGLFASLHCVGMCGPVVMGWQSASSAPVQIDVGGGSVIAVQRSVIVPQVLYHAGRVISYGMIGMMAGFVGGVTMISASVQQSFTIAFGALMIVAALFQLDVFKRRSSGLTNSKAYKALRGLISSNTGESRFLIGLLTPLLPCGLLYGMALHSAATNSPVLGGLEMAVFALGAVPALMIVASLSSMFGAKLRKHGSTFAAVFIMTMGVLTILRGAGIYTNPFETKTQENCCKAPTQVVQPK
ncbi:MAG: sulfite exporter TauE/SafE family protein [Bacteroidetes bacterium]|nr:sulfite exporter TauE/SafE family protein [Bacteroidota bacterium]